MKKITNIFAEMKATVQLFWNGIKPITMIIAVVCYMPIHFTLYILDITAGLLSGFFKKMQRLIGRIMFGIKDYLEKNI